MTARHESLREALGAYTLGALEPDEHDAVQAHLRSCEECRHELDGLAALPPLLGTLTPDEAAIVQGSRPRVDVEPALAVVARERSRMRRSVWTWRVAAGVAAAALAVVTLVPEQDADPSAVFEPRPSVAEASATQGRVQVTAEPWGMRVTIDVSDLPARDGYGLWAVRDDGHKALAASWSALPGDAVHLNGSCYVSVDELARFELRTPDEEVLLTFHSA